MVVWHIDNFLSLVAFLFIKWHLRKNKTGRHRIPFVFSILVG